MTATPVPPVSVADLDRLVARDHHDPHAILGAHASLDGVTIRALHPAAESVVVQPQGVALERIHPAACSRASCAAPPCRVSYELEVRYPDGGTFVTHDPYRFAPTMSDLDEHLFREGRHEQLWSKMGAHERELDGVQGTSFAVWAPAARSVSVVGDFNFWDGRLHMMRALGGSGIWELFVPAVGDGARYKFEIRAQSGELLVKADPFAFATELPPQTASVVHRSTYEWNDADYLAARASDAAPWPADVRLRGPPRLLAAEPAGGQPLADVPRARRRARRLRRRPRLHARRADAGDGAPVQRLVGLPGDLVLRARRRASARPTTSARSSTACTSTASA